MGKVKKKYEPLPYSVNDDIYTIFEFDFEGDKIVPGDVLRFKNTRGRFKFRLFARNIKLDTEWLDVVDLSTGEFKSFRPNKLKGVIRPRKPRKRANN